MSNYTDTFRKPAMTDETGIAIAEKLSGDTASEYKVNTSAEFRKAPMSDETAREILAKIDVDSGLPEVTSDDNGKVLTVVEGEWAKTDSIIEIFYAKNAGGSSDGLLNGKTVGDIIDAVVAGKMVFIRIDGRYDGDDKFNLYYSGKVSNNYNFFSARVAGAQFYKTIVQLTESARESTSITHTTST